MENWGAYKKWKTKDNRPHYKFFSRKKWKRFKPKSLNGVNFFLFKGFLFFF